MGGVLFFLQALSVISSFFICISNGNVSYDDRALIIDGRRRMLISGSIHYPRSTPEMWPDLVQKAKDGGLDVIETYVFWNIHESIRNQYDFGGRKNLVKFIRTVGDAGLYVHLRIGPYVCAEWNYGGFPLWLHFVPGIQFRTDNEPFKAEMKRFTANIVKMMKDNNLYESQGGPIILSQIENEYGNIDRVYGAAGKSYSNWAATMANSLETGVPWVMCQQDDAPDSVINTCNGFYCDNFSPKSNNMPKMWTENWSGWFSSFGDCVSYRPVEDLAFAVARFFQKSGTFQNYYMYHGGTNFDRTSGGPFISTTYDYDAPIDEFGLLRYPKWGHLRDLHIALKLCEEAIVATHPQITSLGTNLEVGVYDTGSGKCAAFLANIGTRSDATVNFRGKHYNIPAWSISILSDCENVVFNTAKVNSITVVPMFKYHFENDDAEWSTFTEPVGGFFSKNSFEKLGLQEQINTTADESDYLWYSISVEIRDGLLEGDRSNIFLHLESLGHALHIFVNGVFLGSGIGNSKNSKVKMDVPITLVPGNNTIHLLSVTVGLQNYGAFFDKMGAGITGPITLTGFSNGTVIDLSSRTWTYKVGMEGEQLDFGSGGSSSLWERLDTLRKKQPLTWYKRLFDSPPGSDPVAVDLSGMGKGEAWVNGHSIGRYWPENISPATGCTDSCNYRGTYSSTKCCTRCGKATQSMYHVPRSWLKARGNMLVLLEERGGDPSGIQLATREAALVCSHVSELHPPPVFEVGGEHEMAGSSPAVLLECPSPNHTVASVDFASFGNPSGGCGAFRHGSCGAHDAVSVVHKACVGMKRCRVEVSIDNFGDPCVGVRKSLAVEVTCSFSGGSRSDDGAVHAGRTPPHLY